MKTEHLYYGCAYYDEYMPYDRIDTDMEMMKRAGMNVIRIAESTWSTWEAEEGVFDFTHLDRMLDASERYGIDVIIGTPTYAIPYWLSEKAEDMLVLTKQGQEIYGRRQNMDITNPVYLKYAERIIRKMMEHIRGRRTVIGYQLDNETKHYDTFGKRAQGMFADYLKEKFGTVEALNQEFGFNYWSNRVDSFDHLPDVRGTINASYGAEYEKFQRTLVDRFLAWQADIIGEYKTENQFVTQNFDFEWKGYSYGLQPAVNHYHAAKPLTVAGCDIYHPSADDLTGKEIAFCGAITRAIKDGENYLILETEAQGNPGWLPFPGQLRLQAYSHLGSGANSVMYWHWHSIHNAIETYWKGVLSHDLQENAIYREACVIGNEFKRYGNQLKNLRKHARAAILLDNESLTGMNWFPFTGTLSYNDIARWLYDCLYEKNVECDVVFAESPNLESYDLLLVPALYSASEGLLKRIHAYVEQGGNLIVTFKSAFCNENLKVYHERQPYLLSECLGIHYDRFTIPKNVSIKSDRLSLPEHTAVSNWMELVTADTAECLAVYDHKFWTDSAAVTLNRFGKGSAMYLGCYFEPEVLGVFVDEMLRQAGIDVPEYHYPVVRKEGVNDDGDLVVYLYNYSSDEQEIVWDKDEAVSLFDGEKVENGERLELNAWDVRIFILE
jgi:beta-galactosidase